MVGNEASSGDHFYKCLSYNAREKNRDGEQKCEWVEYRNLPADDPRINANQMKFTASKKARKDAKDPLFHYVISWHKNDNPTKEQMLEVADTWLKQMGLDEHQVQIASHVDMPYSHIHLGINRVNPNNHISWPKWKFKERSETLIKEFEQEFGWEVVPGKHHPQLGMSFDGRSPEAWEFHQEERMKELAAGIGVDSDSIDGRNIITKCEEINDELWEVVNKGKEGSFKEFDQVLDQQGLWLKAKGQGMVIFDGKYHVKASDISRHFSGPRLEKTFGESLEDYIKERDNAMRREEGIKLATDWKQALEDEEKRVVEQVLVSKLPRMEERYKELKDLNKAFNQGISELEEEISEEVMNAFHSPQKAMGEIQELLDEGSASDQSQRVQEALYENPEQFGKVRDEQAVLYLAESFGKVDKLEGEFAHYFEGRTREERKAELKNMERLLSEKRSQLGSIRSRLTGKARRAVAENSEAGEAVVDSYNKSLSLYRATSTIYSYFIKDRAVGRNTALDTEMAKALKDINDGFDRAFEDPLEAKQFFGEIAWNDYKNETEGVNLIEDIVADPDKFGKVKDSLDLEILEELLKKPQQIREQHKDFLTNLGDIGQQVPGTDHTKWDGQWMEWVEGEAPKLKFGKYEKKDKTLDQIIGTDKNFVKSLEQQDIPQEVKEIISMRDKGHSYEDIFKVHGDFIRRQGSAKDYIEYFKRLPDVYDRDQNMVGGLSVVQELNRWVGRAAGTTPASKAIFKTGAIGIKLAKSLARMLEGPSKGARESVRAVIKDSVSITKVNAIQQHKQRSKERGRGSEGIGR